MMIMGTIAIALATFAVGYLIGLEHGENQAHDDLMKLDLKKVYTEMRHRDLEEN